MNMMMGNMNQAMEDKGKEISLTIIEESKRNHAIGLLFKELNLVKRHRKLWRF